MRGLYKRGQTWWISYQANGKQVRESTHSTNKRIAEKLLIQRRAQVIGGSWELQAKALPSVEQFAPTFLSWVDKSSTRERYRYSLERVAEHFRGLPINKITVPLLYEFQAKRLASGVSPATVNRDVRALSRLISRAKRRGVFSIVNPCKDFEFLNEENSRRIGIPFTRDEEEQLMEFASGWMQVFLTTIIETGMRPKKEALPLRWEDLALDANPTTVTIKLSKTRAGMRTIWLTRHCAETLRDWRLRTGPSFSPFVFANPSRPSRHIVDYQKQWRELAKQAGIENHRVYDARATFASRTNAAGPSLLTVAQLLGHSDTGTLRSYVRPIDENTRAVLAALDASRQAFKAGKLPVQ